MCKARSNINKILAVASTYWNITSISPQGLFSISWLTLRTYVDCSTICLKILRRWMSNVRFVRLEVYMGLQEIKQQQTWLGGFLCQLVTLLLNSIQSVHNHFTETVANSLANGLFYDSATCFSLTYRHIKVKLDHKWDKVTYIVYGYLGRSGETWHSNSVNTSSTNVTLFYIKSMPSTWAAVRLVIFLGWNKIWNFFFLDYLKDQSFQQFFVATFMDGLKYQYQSLYDSMIIILACIAYQTIVYTRAYFNVAHHTETKFLYKDGA